MFTVRSFGLYLADGTLFAIFGQPAVLLEKSAQAMMLLTLDIRFEDIAASSLTFGDANWLNPPATTSVQGVVELATEAEAGTGTDAARAVTPKGLKTAVTTWLDARLGAAAPSVFVKTLLTAASAAAFRLALGLKAAALKDEGAGNGLDADTVDGVHGTELLRLSGGTVYGALRIGSAETNVSLTGGDAGRSGYLEFRVAAGRLGYIGYGADGGPLLLASERASGWNVTGPLYHNGHIVWDAATDGTGSGLDADLLDGQEGGYYTNIPARLGFTPLNAASYTAADVAAKLITVDGSGSGLDADLLDGQHAADLLPTGLLAANGWCRLPNGLILQWGQVAAAANSYTTLNFTIPFPTACFHVSVNAATEVGNTAAADNGPLPVPGTATTAGVSLWSASNAATAWWFAIGI